MGRPFNLTAGLPTDIATIRVAFLKTGLGTASVFTEVVETEYQIGDSYAADELLRRADMEIVRVGGFLSDSKHPVSDKERTAFVGEMQRLRTRLTCTLHLRKRDCFSFEQEWRAVVVARACDRKKKGIEIQVSPGDFIERVLVSPLASSSFLRTVDATCEKFGLQVRPERSQLGRRKPSRGVKP